MMDRSEEIRKRFAAHDPLNLSAVWTEAPHLMEGLWDPEHFIGWRRAVEAAGIAIDRVRVLPGIEVKCPLCGWSAPRLLGHLGPAHGLTIKEIRQTWPEAEELCEEGRAAKMGLKKHRKALALAPHWEPAWSKWYALDRLRWFYDQGIPVNYASIAKGEPGMGAYLRRVMGSWAAALRAIGLDPEGIRLTGEAPVYRREELLEELQRMGREQPAHLGLQYARNGPKRPFFRACLREFKTYEAALREAGLDPAKIIPATTDPEKTARHLALLEATRARIKKPRPYDAAGAAAFLQEWEETVQEFYGTWANLAEVLDCEERNIFHHPPWTQFTTADPVIAALQERIRLGLPVRENDVRIDNSPLVIQAKNVFGSWKGALKAAGVERPPRNLHMRRFTPETLLGALQERHRTGLTLNSYKIAEQRKDAVLMKWARRYFGSWLKALAAAGVPAVERSKPVRKVPQERVPLEKYLNQIRARAAAGLSLRLKDMLGRIDEGGNKGLVTTCRKRFGSWDKAVAAAGIVAEPHRTIRRPYRTEEEVIAELRHRHEAGLPLHYSAIIHGEGSNPALIQAVKRWYPNLRTALEVAGLPVPPSLVPGSLNRFQTKDDIRGELRRRHAAGEALQHAVVRRTPYGTALYKTARKLYGGWLDALEDAGLPRRAPKAICPAADQASPETPE